MTQNKLTHIDGDGNPKMVDVSDKSETKRTAVAKSIVVLPNEVIDQFVNDDLITKKGPVIHTAIIAGVMGAKKTSELIPFCHQLNLTNCKIWEELNGNELTLYCKAELIGKTGVEMEALTGASIAALTVYDMCKALSHDIVIKETRLIEKTGGKSDFKNS